MSDVILCECGAQYDLADFDGALYVPAAETIRPRLAALAAAARERGVPRVALVVGHKAGDPDLAEGKPDYKTTFPAHCMAGADGARQIPESAFERSVEIPREPHADRPVRESLRAYRNEILFEVAGFDPWTHPSMPTLLEVLEPKKVVVYGLPADKLVAKVVDGLLERNVAVAVVADASKPFDGKAWEALKAGWAEKGVEVLAHDQVF